MTVGVKSVVPYTAGKEGTVPLTTMLHRLILRCAQNDSS